MAKKPDPIKSLKKFRRIAKKPTGMGAIRFYLALPFTVAGRITRDFCSGRLSARTHWICEILLVVVVFFLCTLLNRSFGLERFLGGVPALRGFWLGLIAVLLWFVARVSWALMKEVPGRTTRHPDIQIAFKVIEEVAEQVGIDLTQVPLFLVLGLSPDEEKQFASSSLVSDVLVVDDDDLPVHCYGGGEAVWITLPGVSAIVAQRQFAAEVAESGEEGRSNRLSFREKQQLFRRMEYAMRKLARLRAGVVPVNGVLTFVRQEWLIDSRCGQLIDTVKVDMVAAQNNLPVRCHSALVFHGLDQNPAFEEFIDRQPADGLRRRCGCSAPELAQFSSDDADSVHDWLVRFFERTVYRHLATNVDQTASNAKLVKFLDVFRNCGEQFSRILIQTWPDDSEESFYFGGVYFAEVGTRRAAFFDGLLARFVRVHDDVIGWSDSAIRRDRKLKGLATLAAVATVGLVLFDAFLISGLIMRAAR